jgi:hypothetical protein
MYLDELRHFLARVECREPTVQPVPAAAAVLQVALAAKRSARLGCRVATDGSTSWQ